MNEKVELFIKGYFSPEMVGRQRRLVESLKKSSADYRDTVKSGLAELLITRGMTIDYFWNLTSADYGDMDEVYAEIAKVYEDLFNESAPKSAPLK
jgi:hypothetical protein